MKKDKSKNDFKLTKMISIYLNFLQEAYKNKIYNINLKINVIKIKNINFKSVILKFNYQQ